MSRAAVGPLLLLSIAVVSCARGRHHLDTQLANITVGELPDPGYDTSRLRAFTVADRKNPVADARFPRGQAALTVAVPPGSYVIQLDYFKGGDVVMSSIACGDPNQFDLHAGDNPIKIYVCNAAGERFPPDAALCDATDATRGVRQLRLLTAAEYQATVTKLTGFTDDFTAAFPKEVKSHGMTNLASQMVVTPSHAEAYLKAATAIGDKIAANAPRFTACAKDEAEDACATRFVQRFSRQAWRRPANADQIIDLMQVYKTGRKGGDFAAAIGLTVQAMLMSPSFLYRSEVGDKDGDAYALDSWEIAEALAYMYWGEPPDDALSARADRGELKQPAAIEAEAARLLADPRARAMTGRFVASWLGADSVLSVNKDTGLHPDFQSSLRQSLLAETKDFFNSVTFDKGGDFAALFNQATSVGGDDLAKFYPASRSDRTLTFPESERRGLLGHASVLASLADADRTAPVKRGVFVLEKLFCQTLAPPPPELGVMPPSRNDALTTRERFAQHSQAAACSICHTRIDGAGFGLEDMDEVGRFRKEERGRPVDASGQLVGLDGKTSPFKGTSELALLIAQSDTARRCFATQVQRFASGTYGSRTSCVAGRLYDDFAARNFSVRELFLALPRLEAFRRRQD